MNILGISIHRRGSAVCLVHDGRIIAAAREEWFSRVKGDGSYPEKAAMFALDKAGLAPEDVDVVAHASGSPSRRPMVQSWLAPLTRLPARIPVPLPVFPAGGRATPRTRIGRDTTVVENAHAAAASAFYPCPFENAAVLIANGPDIEPACAF